jgi:hypothetical protein
MTDAAPVVAGAVEADAVVVGVPRVVVVPGVDERDRRTPVVTPAVVVAAVEDEVAVDVVVVAAAPVDRRIGLDRLGVGVHVGDDLDPIAAAQGLVADEVGNLLGGLGDRLFGLDVDVLIDDRLGHLHLGGELVRILAVRLRPAAGRHEHGQGDSACAAEKIWYPAIARHVVHPRCSRLLNTH